MYDLKELQQRLETQRPAQWEQLPDFALYMDQVLSYMDRQVIRVDDGDGLTAAMVNNYTKTGLVPRAEGNKYNREHLAYLTAICVMKRVMSTKDMDLLIREELQGDRSVADGYGAFCQSLDKALRIAAQEMDQRQDDPDHLSNAALADSAIHFALMSYAAGVVSSRYVAMLRERKEQEAAANEPPKKHKKDKERD